ncbi:3-methyladenine DNA glycosylase [Modestobacter sp. I12A-02628]|uniref:3-methyladenine DNA glycosylase n=1 Tax=Goekera deserti TaxID=2497753 RepID=A0A7K3WI90_9ACTN|nr:3-methyladenine DNA glycosylase [Goekera deserti]MPQ97815.1 3-methyladenine DNA glycosylase [Goekera deserti]NDI48460.1 3-methyladenine DNA glycosylase [Goekera deserti]NEL56062.1 3-methyladenine DNA glycosylase [Goekera deserti]
METLARERWTALERAHADRLSPWTEPHRERRGRGEDHPVLDFLFTYYSQSPAKLLRWHPGAGRVLLDADERAGWPLYTRVGDGVGLDVPAFLARRGDAVRHTARLLRATAGRAGQFGCFGLHEWAMVYRPAAGELRHSAVPLRLGQAGTDAVVESHRVACSHHDAFRFFTGAGAPRNELAPTRESQVRLEQPGCLHATMDLYKWAYKLAPAVPGELVADCFALAADVRVLDMRASPYDLADAGYPPVAIETPEGKAEYAAAQRGFAERAAPLRARLLAVCDALLSAEGRDPVDEGAADLVG